MSSAQAQAHAQQIAELTAQLEDTVIAHEGMSNEREFYFQSTSISFHCGLCCYNSMSQVS